MGVVSRRLWRTVQPTPKEVVVTAGTTERIWFNPALFWTETKEMTQEEADRLFDRVWRMAEEGDLEGLRDYHFVQVGYPSKRVA
jgi:hypothetical protein